MALRFRKHYTVEEARALLPQIRDWLARIRELQRRHDQMETRLEDLMKGGADVGGATVNARILLIAELHRLFAEFATREIQIKDLDRGLLDFPALMAGREVFLCWEQDEDDIEFWHDIDAGYAGRERI
jgi:hypothetical protein